MADTFLLDLVTPERTFFSGPVKELVAPGSLGEFGVLPGHANMLSELTAGRLIYKDERGETTLVAAGGFAEVTGERVTVLLDDAMYVEELDPAGLEEDITQLEAEALEPETAGFEDWKKQIDWKRFCLEVAKGK